MTKIARNFMFMPLLGVLGGEGIKGSVCPKIKFNGNFQLTSLISMLTIFSPPPKSIVKQPEQFQVFRKWRHLMYCNETFKLL